MAGATIPLGHGDIKVDYSSHLCEFLPRKRNKITFTNAHGGSRWCSKHPYRYGTFEAHIRCPAGNTSGLCSTFYLSSREGSHDQDEIDFEFLGNNKAIVQTNYYVNGQGNHESRHDLRFDCSDGYHLYKIKWDRDYIEWWVDDRRVRRSERRGRSFPEKPMHLYASVWSPGNIDWTGEYVGSHEPYVCSYKDVKVPQRHH